MSLHNCFKCDAGWKYEIGKCWDGWHFPKDAETHNFTIDKPGLYCPPGTELDTPLCYGNTPEGYWKIPHTPMAWMECGKNEEKDLRYNCGVMCTLNEDVCVNTIGHQALSTIKFLFDLGTEDWMGAGVEALKVAKAFAKAKCA